MSCVYVRQYLGRSAGVSLYGSARTLGTRLIEGCYCGAPDAALSEEDIGRLLQSLRVERSSGGSPTSGPGTTPAAVVDWDVEELIRTTPVGRERRTKGGPG